MKDAVLRMTHVELLPLLKSVHVPRDAEEAKSVFQIRGGEILLCVLLVPICAAVVKLVEGERSALLIPEVDGMCNPYSRSLIDDY
jgi:hypothetical protein